MEDMEMVDTVTVDTVMVDTKFANSKDPKISYRISHQRPHICIKTAVIIILIMSSTSKNKL